MKVGIIGRKPFQGESRDVESTLDLLISALVSDSHRVTLDEVTYLNFKTSKIVAETQMVRDYKLLGRSDVIIVIGGDGTMLDTARKYNGTPLIGVNQGRLGFITDIPKDKAVETILDMLRHGLYTTEQRALIETVIGEERVGNALNDVVASRAEGRVIEFNVFIDDIFAFKSRGDGLMISTPTGSTAYAMAAGGPIISPAAKVFEIIPMMPQTMSHRPIVINDTSRIEMELIRGEANVAIDGNIVNKDPVSYSMQTGDILLAQRAPEVVKFWHPRSYDHYQTLRSKLGWQNVPGEKS